MKTFENALYLLKKKDISLWKPMINQRCVYLHSDGRNLIQEENLWGSALLQLQSIYLHTMSK